MSKGDFVPSVRERYDRRNLVTPLDRFQRDRVDEHLPKIAPVDFGAIAGVAAGAVEQDIAVFIDNTFCIFARTDETEERIKQPCSFEGNLTVIFVNIEQASLRSCVRRGFSFVDCCCEAMEMENTGECEATKSDTNNCNWISHCCAPVVTAHAASVGADCCDWPDVSSDRCFWRRWPNQARRVV